MKLWNFCEFHCAGSSPRRRSSQNSSLAPSLAATNSLSVIDNGNERCSWLDHGIAHPAYATTTPLFERLVLTSLNASNVPYCYQPRTAKHSNSFPANTWERIWHQSSLPQLVDPLLDLLATRLTICLDVPPLSGTWDSPALHGMAHGSQLNPQLHHYCGHKALLLGFLRASWIAQGYFLCKQARTQRFHPDVILFAFPEIFWVHPS